MREHGPNNRNKQRRPIIAIDASRANTPHRTGVEWYAYHVIQELKTLIPDTYHVRLYVREPLRDDFRTNVPRHWEVKVKPRPRRFWTQIGLSVEMLLHRPDMLLVLAHVMPIILPRRSLVAVHDMAFMAEERAYTLASRLYLRFAVRIAAFFATRILTVSEFSKREIIRWFGVAPDRIVATLLAYDRTMFHPVTDAARRGDVARRYRIQGPYFIFVGRLERKKNIGAMLAAFRECKRLWPDMAPYRFVLVGKPGCGYEEEMHAERDAKDVLQLGYVRPEDMAALLSGATALVFATRYEGFGIPPLEAMACGTPVIASNTTSLPEICGDAAAYVDPMKIDDIARAMHRMVADPAFRADLSERGIARAAQFSWRTTAKQTWEEMQRVLAG